MNADRITPKQILRLLDEQVCCCAYTGDQLTPETVSADHFIPLGMGGGHELENIRLVTRTVNAAKGMMSYEEFVAMCRKVVEYHDRQAAGVSEAATV